MIKFYQYPNCTTCKKAAKFLQAYGVSFEPIDIVQHTPTKNEFKEIINTTGIDINKLFNTHGAKYRELGLKDKLKEIFFYNSFLITFENNSYMLKKILCDEL